MTDKPPEWLARDAYSDDWGRHVVFDGWGVTIYDVSDGKLQKVTIPKSKALDLAEIIRFKFRDQS